MAKILFTVCLALQVTLSLADCATFTLLSGDTSYVTGGTPIIVSDDQKCSGPTNCFYNTADAFKTLFEDYETFDQNNFTL